MTHHSDDLDGYETPKWSGIDNARCNPDGLRTESVERPAGYLPPYYRAMLDVERRTLADAFDLEKALENESLSEA